MTFPCGRTPPEPLLQPALLRVSKERPPGIVERRQARLGNGQRHLPDQRGKRPTKLRGESRSQVRGSAARRIVADAGLGHLPAAVRPQVEDKDLRVPSPEERAVEPSLLLLGDGPRFQERPVAGRELFRLHRLAIEVVFHLMVIPHRDNGGGTQQRPHRRGRLRLAILGPVLVKSPCGSWPVRRVAVYRVAEEDKDIGTLRRDGVEEAQREDRCARDVCPVHVAREGQPEVCTRSRGRRGHERSHIRACAAADPEPIEVARSGGQTGGRDLDRSAAIRSR